MPRRAGTASRRGLTHLSPRGDARMVDVSAKPETAREAIASAVLRMSPKTLAIVRAGLTGKGVAGWFLASAGADLSDLIGGIANHARLPQRSRTVGLGGAAAGIAIGLAGAARARRRDT